MFSVCSTNIFSLVLNMRMMMTTAHWSVKTWCIRKALPTSLKCLKNRWRNCWIIPYVSAAVAGVCCNTAVLQGGETTGHWPGSHCQGQAPVCLVLVLVSGPGYTPQHCAALQTRRGGDTLPPLQTLQRWRDVEMERGDMWRDRRVDSHHAADWRTVDNLQYTRYNGDSLTTDIFLHKIQWDIERKVFILISHSQIIFSFSSNASEPSFLSVVVL